MNRQEFRFEEEDTPVSFPPDEDAYYTGVPSQSPEEYYVEEELPPVEEDPSQDGEENFHLTEKMFRFLGTMAGIVLILILTVLLISLISWLKKDITGSLLLLSSPIR